MRNLHSLVSIVVLVSAASTIAAADPIKTAKGARFDVTPPSGWTQASPTPSSFVAQDPSGDATMMVFAVDEGDTAKALAGFDKLLASRATDIKWGKKKKAPVTINGLKGFSIDGSATVQGKQKLTTIVVVGTKRAGALMFAAASKDYLKAHGADLLAAFKTIKSAP